MRPARGLHAARATAVAAFAVIALCALGAFVLDFLTHDSGIEIPAAPGWVAAWRGLVLGSTGALLLARLSWHPVPVLLTAGGLLAAIDGLALAWLNHGVLLWPDAPMLGLAFVFTQRLSVVAYLALPLALLVFPDGRLPRGPLRIVAIVTLALNVLIAAADVAMPWRVAHAVFGSPDPRLLQWARGDWGVTLPPSLWQFVGAVWMPTVIASVVLTAAVLFGRMVGADSELRRQLKWIVWSGLVYAALFVLAAVALPYHLGQATIIVGTAVICGSIVVAITRHGLYRIDRLLSWTIVYALFAISVVAVDVLLVASIGRLVEHQVLAGAAMLIVLFAYMPLRDRVLTVANRLVNGRRSDPYGVVSTLAARLEEADEPGDQLHSLAASIATAFASRYVGVRVEALDGGHLVAQHGTPTDEVESIPLFYRGERIGVLEMSPGRRARLSPGDERLLADLVRHAASAVRASTLSTELQQIREQLVNAREDERRRLRRELHDGLGPDLAGVQLRIEAARNVAASDPAESDRLLASAADDLRLAVGEIRRLAHDLRPPSLDDVGLAGAIEQLCRRFGGPPAIELDCDLPARLPAAVEVAVYRIVTEALVNVQRHAHAQRAWVRISRREGRLLVEIDDDGRGVAADAPAGVGLLSMRERAVELGGSLEVTERQGGGTAVKAALPLPSPVIENEVTADV
ncbi:histidine kinase [Agromyces sp. SYSU K20354]|uniref:sensor histidine kinase n=1 Tax=Agromyces cavernae TaxID=2898659 RepID=UPI001E37BC5A|nr:histidine kinase [Agromyces cavernae]MCD2442666.1 histidine kinase [Agromyces cavernae]